MSLQLDGRERPLLIGVVHLRPTVGAPRYEGSMAVVRERALADARALQAGGCDALIVENFGDAPFFADEVPPETVAAMALCVASVQEAASGIPVGVNVLRNAAAAALGLCAATGASFMRVNVHTGAYVTDQGLVQGRAAETMRSRARIAPDVKLLADVHVKHGRPLGETDLVQCASDAWLRAGADALIVTGAGTGVACDVRDLVEIRRVLPDAPLLVGSGFVPEDATELLAHADGAIVGTALKFDGRVENAVDVERVRAMRAAMSGAR